MTETVEDVLRRYDAALAFLDALGVNTTNNRLARYRNLLSTSARVAIGDLKHAGPLNNLASVLYEVSDILDIATLDAQTFDNDACAREKLVSISSGRDFTTDYKPGEHDRARDNAFELSAAAHLRSFNAFHGFSTTNGDVLIRDGGCIRPGECKRLTVASGLNYQIDKAIKQIRRQTERHGACAGLVLIDVTSAAQVLQTLHRADSDEHLARIADERLTAVVLSLREIFQKGNRHPLEVLGIAVRLNAIGYAGLAHNLRRVTTWQFVDLQESGSPESLVFRSLAASLSGEGLVDHIDWQPKSLSEAVAALYPTTPNLLAQDFIAAGYGELLDATAK